ncbi:hypothetical protein M1M30_gp117 [Maribacter phage Colly_1]|uniref:DNA-binding protein n=1 Tax=Maribacter phage Colly_1 TaxID=2745691 RepID=A0A8E4XZQ0_9CAUD|nr:hypothetical protein M1M30_gp117 [Maribacter phage Colly_1]QQO97215.1 hypothetical protein Colly1_117 [Maribacter phage Colly_1]
MEYTLNKDELELFEFIVKEVLTDPSITQAELALTKGFSSAKFNKLYGKIIPVFSFARFKQEVIYNPIEDTLELYNDLRLSEGKVQQISIEAIGSLLEANSNLSKAEIGWAFDKSPNYILNFIKNQTKLNFHEYKKSLLPDYEDKLSPIRVDCIENGVRYNSISEAASKLKLNKGNLGKAINKGKSIGGYTFKVV